MTGNLYFLSSQGEERLVKENIEDGDKVFCAIHEYINSLNPDFRIFYIRCWEENGETVFDVGSHTEFFKFRRN